MYPTNISYILVICISKQMWYSVTWTFPIVYEFILKSHYIPIYSKFLFLTEYDWILYMALNLL